MTFMKAYDRDGNELPGDFITVGRLLTDEDYKRVDQTQVGPYWISTVWLGWDHGFGMSERPLIFETMVFAVDRDDPTITTLGPDIDGRRYGTIEEARQGHAEFVTLIQATLVEDINERSDDDAERR